MVRYARPGTTPRAERPCMSRRASESRCSKSARVASGRRQATADARTKLARLPRQTASLSLTLPDDPAIVAGGRVTTDAWGGEADGIWTVTRVTHTSPKTGNVTELTADLTA